jgi:Fe2+ transport system protein FeoA
VQVGKDLTVIAKQPFGPIVIEIDDIQTAIGRGMAHKICVRLRSSVDRDQEG